MNNPKDEGGRTVTTRTVELIVASLFMAVAAAVMYDSWRIGARWGDFGPEAGYFPFYVGLIMFLASAATFMVNLFSSSSDTENFVEREQFWHVLHVLAPAIVFVALIGWLGMYVATAIFLTGFMWLIGRYPHYGAALTGVGVALFLFWLFERTFLVPLPKGPLESALGY